MKRYSIAFTFLFLFCVFNTFSQQQEIKLNLKEGYEYIFETSEKYYGLKQDNTSNIYRNREKQIKITVEKFDAENEAIVSVNYLKNSIESPYKNHLINKFDLFYPNFSPENYLGTLDIFERFLCKNGIRFSINLQTRKIKIIEREIVLEDFYLYLKNLGYKEKELKSAIDYANTKYLPVSKELVSHLVWFHNATIDENGFIQNSLIDDKLKINTNGPKHLTFSNLEFDKLIPGKTHKKYWIDLENGIVTNFTSVKRDSAKRSLQARLQNVLWNVNENNLLLISSKPIPENVLTVSGEIENPLSNKIHIKFLEKPFGVEMRTKTLVLDGNNRFSTSVDFKNGCFVYIENENKNKHHPPKTYVFYAEPGDTIGFIASGLELPWNIKFLGNRIAESELIEKIRKTILVDIDTGRISSRSKVIFDRDLSLGISWSRGEVYGREKVQKYFREFEKTEKLFSNYNKTIDEKAFNFIKNETQSYLYSGFFQFLTSNYNWLFTDIQDTSGRSVVSATYNPAYNEFTDIRDKIEQQNIHEIYNDYGLYSRKMVESYYRYEFNKTNKIDNSTLAGFGVNYVRDIESRIQFMRLILTGAPLYRELAAALNSVLVKNDRIYFYISRDEYNTNTALEKIDLFSKLCNDVELSSALKGVAQQHQKLLTEDYLPELSFLNLNGEKVTFKDFSGDKPTVFCISEGWGNSRYQFDDLAKENTDINFVMVCENTSFETWKEYTLRAEPVAKHLLYANNKKSVRDIFQKPYVYFVLDKNGEFVEYVRNTKSGIKVARKSLEPKKKELNKSQLKIIILALGILILIAIVVFAIWKWRVRQRFRKEAQIRKLRELELTAIRSQMNPHFLFNCLNSVQNLVQQNKGREAHLYLADFAGLIRKVLRNSEKEEISLAEELEMTEQYLNLEKLRFDFDFEIQVERGIDINNTMVPSMLLQPFAENAVIHGLQSKPRNRKIKIEISKYDKKTESTRLAHKSTETPGILISIEDNGIGREAAKKIAKVKNGKGSKLIQERLEILQEKQGEKYKLEIIDLTGEEIGTRVEIFIPEEK